MVNTYSSPAYVPASRNKYEDADHDTKLAAVLKKIKDLATTPSDVAQIRAADALVQLAQKVGKLIDKCVSFNSILFAVDAHMRAIIESGVIVDFAKNLSSKFENVRGEL